MLGVRVSAGSLGDVSGIALALFGVICFFRREAREYLVGVGGELDDAPARIRGRVVLGFTALYVLVVVSHKLRAQSLIGTHAYDLGFFSNICWNTAHGNWFWSSEVERNFMAIHANWILWPLSFLYKGGGDARILLVCQAMFVAASIPLIWMLVRHITGSFAAGALGSLLFVCSPYINHAVSNDFHPDLWMLPCLFASLLCWRHNQPVATVVTALLAILAKEDVSVVVCAWGALLFFKRWRWTGAILFLSSLAIFLFQIKFFIPHFLGEAQTSLLFHRYAFLSDGYTTINPLLLLKALVYEPTKYLRMAAYVLPVGGLVCLAPSFLFPPLVSLLPHLLSQASTQLNLADIYSMPSQPFLFAGAAFGTVRLAQWRGTKWLGHGVAALIVIAGFNLSHSPRYVRSKELGRLDAFREMKALIPHDASLLAQQNLLPQFDTRRFVQIFPIGPSFAGLKASYLANPEYVACDRIGNALPFDGPYLARAIAAWEADPGYEKIFEKKNFIVFKRKNEEPLRWLTPEQIN